MKLVSIILGLCLMATVSYAAVVGTHPRIWLTETYLTELRGRAAGNSDEWVTLKAWCDDNINTAGYDEGNYRWPGTSGYRGFGYSQYLISYALAYQMLKVSDPTTAATYATYALQIMDGIATGFGVGEDPAYGLACMRVGEIVDGTVNIDEAAALGLYERGYKIGYTARSFGVAVPVAYDWLHDELSAGQKTIFTGMMYRWVDWYRGERSTYNNGVLFEGTRYYENDEDGVGAGENENINGTGKGYAWENVPHNFFGGRVAMTALVAYATYGDSDDDDNYLTVWEDLFTNIIKVAYESESDLKGGDAVEGWNYASGHSRIIQAMRAMDTASDSAPFTDFDIAKEFFLCYMHHTKPNLIDLYDHGTWTGTYKGRPYEGAMLSYQTLLNQLYPTEDYGKYSQYYADNVTFVDFAKDWDRFLWYDPDATATFWDAEPLFYRAIGTGIVTMRSTWTDAVDSVWASVQLDNLHRVDHEHYEEGHFTIQRGDDYLIRDGAGGGTLGHSIIRFGGSGQREGVNEKIAIYNIENTTDYMYVAADIAGAYWFKSSKWVTEFLRKFLFIRPNIFVILDDITSEEGYESKQWMINFNAEPTLDTPNHMMESTVGVSKVFVKTLTPTVYGIDYDFYDNWQGEAWRVDIVPTVEQADDTFLHAIYVTSSGTESMPSTVKIDSTVASMTGVHIKDTTETVALFNIASDTISPPVEYTFSPLNICNHYLFDMPSITSFSVAVVGDPDVVTVTEDVSGEYVSSSGGVVTFSTGEPGEEEPPGSEDYIDDANCQGVWLMDTDENPLTDSSQNSNTAALFEAGGPNYSVADPPPIYPTGYYTFDGSDDRCDITNDASLDPGGDFSIVAWIYLDSFGDSNYGRIFDSLTNNNGYSFYVNNNPAGSPAGTKTLSANIGDGALTYSSGNDNIIDTGSWLHVAMVFDDTENTVVFYVGGAAYGGFACTRTPGASGIDATIGDRNGNDRSFHGRIDEVAFFDRVLTSAEISDIKDNGFTGAVVGGSTIRGATIYGWSLD